MTPPSPNDLYKGAQALMNQGQPVFPCFSSGTRAKRPMTKNGFKDATLDKDKVKRWWRNHGDAAIGIPTGILWDVLDVDTKSGTDGRIHLPRLQRLGLLNGCQFVVRTPSGGWHLYFPAAPGLTNKARATLGLDVRSLGGYVLAPPSWIDDGEASVGAYEMIGTTTDSNTEPLLWDLILSTLAPVNEKTKQPVALLGYERQASVASLRGWLSERVSGERNNALHWAVCRCIENGIDPNELLDVALMIGLTEDECSKTINSALMRSGVAAEDLDTEAEAMFKD